MRNIAAIMILSVESDLSMEKNANNGFLIP